MKLSDRGLQLIRTFESLRLEPYTCPSGDRTVGYGHKLLPGEAEKPITEQEAEALLRHDVAFFERGINDICGKLALTQGEYDACVCFSFNVGLRAFAKSTLLKCIEANDRYRAAQEFMRWVNVDGKHSAGLERRRHAESYLFLS